MKKILIVDDERDFVFLMQDFLKAHGFETLTAFEGVRGIEAAHKGRPDLILLDLKMPAGDGQTVLNALKSLPDTRTIPVIVITALGEKGLKEKILGQGAQGFVEKPFEMQSLLALIQRWI